MEYRFHHGEEGHCHEAGECQEHTHCHDHDHEHGHEHCHSCGGCHREETPADKTIALLTYMVDHNRHHVMELEELAEEVEGAAAEKIARAIETFCAANEQLTEALHTMLGK